jgi:type II secretory pathway component PulL
LGSPPIVELVGSRRWDRVICSLPARAAYYRFLDLPFRDHRRLAQAVGPALEEHVPLSLDDAVTSFDVTGGRRTGRVLAAMVRRTVIDEIAQSICALGITPSQWVWEPTAVLAAYRGVLDPQQPTLIVDVGIDCTVVATCAGGEVSGLRVIAAATEAGFARDLGWAVRTLETTAERAVLGGHHHENAAAPVAATLDSIRVETLPLDCPVALAERAQSAWRSLTTVVGLTLVAGGDAEPPILSFAPSGETAPSVGNERREMARRLAPWAGATLLLLAIAGGIDAARLLRDVTRLEHAADRIFSTAMPGVPGGAGQRMKLDLKLAELERRQTELAGGVPADSALGILVSMSDAIPDDLEVEFESYAYDPPNVRLRGQGGSFESVTRLQQLLRESTPYKNIDVGDVRSAASGEGVQFELTIRLGEPRPPT